MSDLLHINDTNYEEIIEKGTKPVLLDFGATWCAPCKALEPSIVALAQTYGDRVMISKVDVDEAQQIALRFQVMAVPTVIFLKNGKEVHRFVGTLPKDKVENLIKTHLL